MKPFSWTGKSDRPRKKLYNLTPHEVSLVDEPSNQKRILVLKRQSMADLEEKIEQAMASVDPQTLERVDATVAKLAKQRVSKAAMPGGDTASVVPGEAMTPEAQEALKAAARLLAPFANQITDTDMDVIQEEIGIPDDDVDEAAENPPPPPPPTPPAGRREIVKEADPEDDEEDDKVGAADGGKDEEDDDGDQKQDDDRETGYKKRAGGNMDDKDKVEKRARAQERRLEEVFKRAAVLEDQNKELVSKLARQEQELAVEREMRLNREYLAMAQERYPNLGDAQAVAKVLKSAHGADKQHRDQLEAVLKAANARIETAQSFSGDLFGERGSRQGDPAAGSPEAQLESLVDGYVRKSAGEKTREQIYSEVLKSAEGKRLYAMSRKDIEKPRAYHG